MSEELKSCPFCGSREISTPHPSDFNTWVHCLICMAEGPVKDTAHAAIAAWNTRAGEKA
ncbi:Lar family restriction alleviation protein [Acetobacter oryzoeni]|uniref:Restriction alleviation protein, Lar family n=1 Tax=Acetobacter oryzoeni TaxID=2500548 RepID=A0A5B9GII2_9PROT|nr:restriction alleviation protein, Lar family [Acetobacter oryzoeni]